MLEVFSAYRSISGSVFCHTVANKCENTILYPSALAWYSPVSCYSKWMKYLLASGVGGAPADLFCFHSHLSRTTTYWRSAAQSLNGQSDLAKQKARDDRYDDRLRLSRVPGEAWIGNTERTEGEKRRIKTQITCMGQILFQLHIHVSNNSKEFNS